MNQSPYEPPGESPPVRQAELLTEQSNSERPPVWRWYVAYCLAMAVLYLACLVGGIFLLTNASSLAEEADDDRIVFIVQGAALSIIGGLLFILFAAAPFLPRGKWAWFYGFVTIGIGLTSACCLPASIPLLIFWLKEPNKRYMCG